MKKPFLLHLIIFSFFLSGCNNQQSAEKASWSGTYEFQVSPRKAKPVIGDGWRSYWELNLVENNGVLLYHDSRGIADFTLAVRLKKINSTNADLRFDSVVGRNLLAPTFNSWKKGDLVAEASRKKNTLSISSVLFSNNEDRQADPGIKLFEKVKTRKIMVQTFTNDQKRPELKQMQEHGEEITSDIQLR